MSDNVYFSACNCDPIGSLDLQCDQYGYCPCRPSVDGRRCDRCQENKYNMSAGCLGESEHIFIPVIHRYPCNTLFYL